MPRPPVGLTPQFSGYLSMLAWMVSLVLLGFTLALARSVSAILIFAAGFCVCMALAGLLTRWSDCPMCGKSAFRPQKPSFWRTGIGLFDVLPERTCSQCGTRLDEVAAH